MSGRILEVNGRKVWLLENGAGRVDVNAVLVDLVRHIRAMADPLGLREADRVVRENRTVGKRDHRDTVNYLIGPRGHGL